MAARQIADARLRGRARLRRVASAGRIAPRPIVARCRRACAITGNYCGGRLNCAQSIRLLMSRPFDRTPPKRHDGRAIECRSRKSSLTNFLDNCPSDTGNYSRDGVTGMFFNRKPEKSLCELTAEFIFQNSPDAYFVLDGAAICECNAALEKFMGQPRDKLIGVTPDRLSPERQPDGRPSSEAAVGYINAAMSKGCARFEWMHRRLDGSPLPMEVTLLRADLGGRPALISFWHDLRETMKLRQVEQIARAQAAETAQQQKAALDALAAALAGLAKGDLTIRVTQPVAAAYQALKDDFNRAMEAVHNALASIAGSAEVVMAGSARCRKPRTISPAGPNNRRPAWKKPPPRWKRSRPR